MSKFILSTLSCVFFSHSSFAMNNLENTSEVRNRIKKVSLIETVDRNQLDEKTRNSERYFRLGVCEYEKEDVESDKLALRFFQVAANDYNNDMAQNNLGVFYENGLGTPKNLQLAKKWYGKAAENGNKDAKEALKNLVEREKDYAYRLFGIF